MVCKKMMKSALIVAVIALILVFAFVFVACGKNNNNNNNDNGGTVIDDGNGSSDRDNTDGNTDDNTDDKKDDNKDDNTGDHTDDNAGDDTEESPICKELQPLYELLSAEGDKGIKLTVTGGYTAETGAEAQSFSLNAIVNILKEGNQFALYSGEDVFAFYKDGEIVLGNNAIDVSRLAQLVMSFFAAEEYEEPVAAGEADEGIGDTVGAINDGAEGAEMDRLTYAFVTVSNMLGNLDSLKASLIPLYPGLEINHSNGVYIVTADSNTLVAMLQEYISDAEDDEQAEESVDITDIISSLDEYLDGAIMGGKIKVQAELVFSDNGVLVKVSFENVNTGLRASLQADVRISNNAFELPSIENTKATAKDLQISIPMTLPQKEIAITVDTVVHISDMFAEAGKDYLTASVTANGKDLVRFNFNDYYVYLDITGLLQAFAAEGEKVDYTAFYYTSVDKAGEPVSFLDSIVGLFAHRYGADYGYEDEDYGDGDEDDNGDDNDDSGEEDAYYVNYVDYQFVTFQTGAEEADLRKAIFAGYYDSELDKEVEITDYRIIGFDTSDSFYGDVTILFGNGIERELEVVVYNPETKVALGFNVEDFKVELGTAVDKAEFYAAIAYTDGKIFWVESLDDVTVVSINGKAVTVNSVFDKVGENKVSFAYEGFDAEASVYVNDPDNPIIIGIDSMTMIGISMDDSEETIRNTLGGVRVVMDNGEEYFVDDYAIVDYEPGVDSFSVVYKGFTAIVRVEYVDDPDYPADEDGAFNILELLPYLRFVELGEEDDTMAVVLASIDHIKAILADESNKALFANVLTYEKIENGFVASVIINNKDDVDLLSVINLFVGIPTEDGGFVDLNESMMFDDLSNKGLNLGSMYMPAEAIATIFKRATGYELKNAVSDLCLEIRATDDSGWCVMFKLSDCSGDNVYFETGVKVHLIPQAAQFELSADEIEKAHDFNEVAGYLMPILAQLLNEAEEGSDGQIE